MAGVPVKVQVARSVSVSDTTEYVATLKSRDSAVIMPEVEGRITAISVRSGEQVTRGTPLMQIDPSKQQATVNSQEHSRAAQEANLAYAQQQYDRISGLFAAGVVPRQDLDQAKSALDTLPKRNCDRSMPKCSSRGCNCTTTAWSRPGVESWAIFRCGWAIASPPRLR
jgi:RND family efflux transporter MFP subunit